MIENLYIKNFKSIRELDVKLTSFNLLTGTNSSGKSSTIQALLLLSQNLDDQYGLNGPLVSVGEYREVKNFNIKSDDIVIGVYSGDENLKLTIKEDKIDISGEECSLAEQIRFSNQKLKYLSCNRIGSQDIYRKNRTVNGGIGINGEYAIDSLCVNKDVPLDDLIVKDKSNYTLLAQTNYWLKYIVGANIRAEAVLETDVVKAQYGMVEGRYSRPQNVGSGISYLISIIILCLGSKKGDILLIENPEIHLHPMSQSRLCEFLHFVSKADRQVILETHSDHFFNAVRAGVATDEMNIENIGINFFKLGSDNCTRNYIVEIGKNGKIETPLPNLFDQFQIDLDKMLGV